MAVCAATALINSRSSGLKAEKGSSRSAYKAPCTPASVNSGAQIVERTPCDTIESTPAIASDGTVYFGCSDQKLYALDGGGTKLWEFVAGSTVICSPVIREDGSVCFGAFNSKFYAVAGSSGLAGGAWPVGSKLSCGLSVVEPQQASQSLSGLDFANRFSDPVRWGRKENYLPLSLMVSLMVKMRNVHRQHTSQ